MSLAHRYQDFGPTGFEPGSTLAIPEEGLEELKLDSFEDGYQAGWEDAVKAQASDKDRAVAEMVQCLQDLSFTHQEAFVKLNSAMRPLLTKIATSLLPDLAKGALGPHVLQQLDELINDNAQNAIEIAVAPENLEPLQELLEGRVKSPFLITPEPALSSGQVYLRTNCTEREINLDAVMDGITAALNAFFVQTQEDTRHG